MEFLYSVAPNLAILRFSSFSHLLIVQMTNYLLRKKISALSYLPKQVSF